MNKFYYKPKNIRNFAIALLSIILMAIGITILTRLDEVRFKQYAIDANPIGVAYAKEKCLGEGLSDSICATITGKNGSTNDEWMGKSAWIVYAKASDQYVYSSSVVVQYENNKLVVVDYVRDTVSK